MGSIAGAALVLAWVGGTGAGFLLLDAHQARPGAAGSPPDRWPAGAATRPDPARPTLVIFLHPLCPCSAASVAELAEVEARCRGRVAIRAVIGRPEGQAAGWGPSGSIESGLAGMAGLARVDDPGGREGRRFGVETSGQVLLYGPGGRLLFAGGITPSRGHRGESRGREALVGLIDGAAVAPGRSPVFGCRVVGSGRQAGEGGGS